jgi:hypothetical protein
MSDLGLWCSRNFSFRSLVYFSKTSWVFLCKRTISSCDRPWFTTLRWVVPWLASFSHRFLILGSRSSDSVLVIHRHLISASWSLLFTLISNCFKALTGDIPNLLVMIHGLMVASLHSLSSICVDVACVMILSHARAIDFIILRFSVCNNGKTRIPFVLNLFLLSGQILLALQVVTPRWASAIRIYSVLVNVWWVVI